MKLQISVASEPQSLQRLVLPRAKASRRRSFFKIIPPGTKKIPSLARCYAQAVRNFFLSIADNQIDGNERRQPDHAAQIGRAEEFWQRQRGEIVFQVQINCSEVLLVRWLSANAFELRGASCANETEHRS